MACFCHQHASILVEWLGFDTVFHSVAGTFNYNRFGVVKKVIEDGGGNGAIAVEDRRPLFEGFVGGDDDGTAFVSLADDLEKQVGSALIYGQVADFVQNQECGREIAFEFGFERPLSLGGTQGIDCVDGVGKKDAVAVLASSVAESRSQMGFAEAAQT